MYIFCLSQVSTPKFEMSDYGGGDDYDEGGAGYEYVCGFRFSFSLSAFRAHCIAIWRIYLSRKRQQLTGIVTTPSTSTRNRSPMSSRTTTTKPPADKTQTLRTATTTIL